MHFIIHGHYENGCKARMFYTALSIEHVLRLFPALFPNITITEVEELHS